jgi:hypothetical protein
MLELATLALVAAGVLSAAAVASFVRFAPTARHLLRSALVVAIVGTMAAVLGGHPSALRAWTLLFAAGACGCFVTAARNLLAQPARWVHRFVIYAGYGATFALMGAGGLWLETRAIAGWPAAGMLVGVYAVGAAAIFLAKTLIVRRTAQTMPEYHDSLAAGQDGPDYW